MQSSTDGIVRKFLVSQKCIKAEIPEASTLGPAFICPGAYVYPGSLEFGHQNKAD